MARLIEHVFFSNYAVVFLAKKFYQVSNPDPMGLFITQYGKSDAQSSLEKSNAENLSSGIGHKKNSGC